MRSTPCRAANQAAKSECAVRLVHARDTRNQSKLAPATQARVPSGQGHTRARPPAFKTRLHPAPAHPGSLQNPSPPRSGASRPPSKPVSTPLRRIPSHLTSPPHRKTDLPIKSSVEP
ncbi:hypothetical protein VPH35_016989 [Triticum aestivum]